jgi:hypothetical protein
VDDMSVMGIMSVHLTCFFILDSFYIIIIFITITIASQDTGLFRCSGFKIVRFEVLRR